MVEGSEERRDGGGRRDPARERAEIKE